MIIRAEASPIRNLAGRRPYREGAGAAGQTQTGLAGHRREQVKEGRQGGGTDVFYLHPIPDTSLFIKDWEQEAVAFLFHIFIRDKTDGSAVDTITQAARFRRPVVENMAQMAVTHSAAHLRTVHVVAGILLFIHHLRSIGFGKAGPAAAGIKLILLT